MNGAWCSDTKKTSSANYPFGMNLAVLAIAYCRDRAAAMIRFCNNCLYSNMTRLLQQQPAGLLRQAGLAGTGADVQHPALEVESLAVAGFSNTKFSKQAYGLL